MQGTSGFVHQCSPRHPQIPPKRHDRPAPAPYARRVAARDLASFRREAPGQLASFGAAGAELASFGHGPPCPIADSPPSTVLAMAMALRRPQAGAPALVMADLRGDRRLVQGVMHAIPQRLGQGEAVSGAERVEAEWLEHRWHGGLRRPRVSRDSYRMSFDEGGLRQIDRISELVVDASPDPRQRQRVASIRLFDAVGTRSNGPNPFRRQPLHGKSGKPWTAWHGGLRRALIPSRYDGPSPLRHHVWPVTQGSPASRNRRGWAMPILQGCYRIALATTQIAQSAGDFKDVPVGSPCPRWLPAET